ncbi:aqualysin-1-like [Glandiceps talaboti]
MRILILALFVAAASAASLAPLFKAKVGDAVPNSYMVKLKDGVDISKFIQKVEDVNTFVRNRYTSVFYGVSIDIYGKNVATLRSMDEVEYIEENMIMRATVEWGCDRIDQRNLPLDGQMIIHGDGSGAHVYIADTGIRHTHVEFEGRASFFWDFDSGGDGDDCNGHGTHCAGTATGRDVGVAIKADVYSVRVLNCAGIGLTSNIVNGLDAIATDGTSPGLCSMSLGGGASTALDNAVRDLVSAGYSVPVAAGNDNGNACNTSPARESTADTVGSTTSTDARSGFSNYGTCVDLFAPGSSVRSSWHSSDTAYNTISGTSMACPHVAGILAVNYGSGRCSSPSTCSSTLVSDATSGVISNPGAGSPNLLAYCT